MPLETELLAVLLLFDNDKKGTSLCKSFIKFCDEIGVKFLLATVYVAVISVVLSKNFVQQVKFVDFIYLVINDSIKKQIE